MSYKDFQPRHPYEMHYQDYRSWSVHASPMLIARVNELAHELSKTQRHRVTNGEVLELALAALDRELGDAPVAAASSAPETPDDDAPDREYTFAEIEAETKRRRSQPATDA